MTRVLFHRHTPWQAEIRCSTNIYASMFMQDGFDVAYMQGLVHIGHALTGRGQWSSFQRGPRHDRGAWVFTPFSVVPYAARWPLNTAAAAHMSYRNCVPGIDTQLARGMAEAPDVIWSANPGSVALRAVFPRAKFVFQVVDYYPAFSGPSIKALERADYQGADHIFVIGETLKRYIVAEHGIEAERITVLGQGVFGDAYHGSLPMPADMMDLPRPIGVWVGVLSKADPALFRAAADALARRGGSMLLIGPRAPWVDRLCAEVPSVRALGSRSPESVPAYLVNADLGLMLYDQSRQAVYRGQNPLKLYEFAAAGLATLSTPHDEFEFLDPPVITVSVPLQVEGAIETALRERSELAMRARDFAAAHGWGRAFQRAKQQIAGLLAS